MIKRVLMTSILIFVITACSSGRNESYEIVNEVMGRGYDIQNVQIAQSQVLPPYGVKVTAEMATLNLRIVTSQKDTLGRVEDIQKAVYAITALADENESIALVETSVNQVSGSYAKEESSTRNIQNLDTSGIVLKLTTKLSQHNYDYLKCIAEFNDFLDTINLPNTINVQALSLEADLGDLDAYRSQIIELVYRELNSVQDEYGEDVKFEILGLYDPLKKIQLSDNEYFLYLEPIVTTLEF